MSWCPASSLIRVMSVPLSRRFVQYVWRRICGVKGLSIPAFHFSSLEAFRLIVAVPTARDSGRYEYRRAIVRAIAQESPDPVDGGLREKVRSSALAALSNNIDLGAAHFKWRPVMFTDIVGGMSLRQVGDPLWHQFLPAALPACACLPNRTLPVILFPSTNPFV